MIYLNGSTNLVALVNAVGNAVGNQQVDANRIQKTAYILKKKGVSFSEKFTFNFNGLYSSDIEVKLSDLVEQHCLIQSQAGSKWTYLVNEKFLSSIQNTELEDKKELINSLVELDDKILSVVSTIFYLKEIGYEDIDFLKKKVGIINPELRDTIDQGAEKFQAILQA